MDKDKKKTLTISSNLKKKIDTRSISTTGKKSFFVEKKKPFKAGKPNRFNNQNVNSNQENKKKILLENLSNNRQQKISSKKIINLLEKAN